MVHCSQSLSWFTKHELTKKYEMIKEVHIWYQSPPLSPSPFPLPPFPLLSLFSIREVFLIVPLLWKYDQGIVAKFSTRESKGILL